MIDTELLLRHTPEDAIVMMVNAENGTHFPTGTFEFGLPEAIDGTRQTRIRLKVRESHARLDEVPYEGEFDFIYNRLDLSDHFGGVLAGFNPSLPISTQVVLDELNRRLKQNFFLDDIVLEEIGRTNASPYVLKAKVESLRWFGQVEFFLADTQDLTAFFDLAIPKGSGPQMGTLSNEPNLRSVQHYDPYVNATSAKDLVADLIEGNFAQDQTSLVPLIQRTVAAPGLPLNPSTALWVLSETPAPFNLFNAKMPALPSTAANAFNPNLNRLVQLQLDTHMCTNLDDVNLVVPYREDDFTNSSFTDQPRLSRYAVKSLTDASAYAKYLNSLPVGTIIRDLGGAGGSMYIDGPVPFVTDADTPSQTNLYEAVVIYNGQRRVVDNKPADPALNFVMVVALSAMNTAYKGNFEIHYKAPIVLPVKIPDAELGKPFSFSLAATGGVGPYTYSKFEGDFAPNQTLDSATGLVSGSATSAGNAYAVGVRVTDSVGTSVDYRYVYAVTVAPLLVSGNAPDAVVGQAYDFSYTIVGGVAPYDTLFLATVPSGLTWDRTAARLYGTPLVAAQGVNSWTIATSDQQGIEIFRDDSIFVGA